jgi:hypothetical protein
MAKKIILMADYQCFPLWEIDQGVKRNIDPASLPLSQDLIVALRQWQLDFDQTLNQEYPPESGFSNQANEEAFDSQGIHLCTEMQRQLGDTFSVLFHSIK